jgi:hypothetical protein
MRTREVSNREDILDSRDIIKRIEELESDRQNLIDATQEAQEAIDAYEGDTEGDEFDTLHDTMDAARDEMNAWGETDEGRELTALKALEEEASGSPDWIHGEALIRDSYFQDYAEQLADDLGAIDPKAANNWPTCHIDWEEAADALKADYMEVAFDGVAYWILA